MNKHHSSAADKAYEKAFARIEKAYFPITEKPTQLFVAMGNYLSDPHHLPQPKIILACEIVNAIHKSLVGLRILDGLPPGLTSAFGYAACNHNNFLQHVANDVVGLLEVFSLLPDAWYCKPNLIEQLILRYTYVRTFEMGEVATDMDIKNTLAFFEGVIAVLTDNEVSTT